MTRWLLRWKELVEMVRRVERSQPRRKAWSCLVLPHGSSVRQDVDFKAGTMNGQSRNSLLPQSCIYARQ